MYAVIDAGGHQHRVQEGELLRIELRKDLEPGEEITLDAVLLLGGPEGVQIGTPRIEGASVAAVVEANRVKGPKVRGMKRRRINSSKTKFGHRQKYTLLRIGSIKMPGA